MDDDISRIVETLDRRGLRENMFAFFQSDSSAMIEDRTGLGGRNTQREKKSC